MKRFFILLWAIPTWCLTNLFVPFLPETHPWKNRFFSLPDWAYGRKGLTKNIDSALWGQIVFLIILFSTI